MNDTPTPTDEPSGTWYEGDAEESLGEGVFRSQRPNTPEAYADLLGNRLVETVALTPLVIEVLPDSVVDEDGEPTDDTRVTGLSLHLRTAGGSGFEFYLTADLVDALGRGLAERKMGMLLSGLIESARGTEDGEAVTELIAEHDCGDPHCIVGISGQIENDETSVYVSAPADPRLN